MTSAVSIVSKVLSKSTSPNSTDSSARHAVTARAITRHDRNFIFVKLKYKKNFNFQPTSRNDTFAMRIEMREEEKEWCMGKTQILLAVFSDVDLLESSVENI